MAKPSYPQRSAETEIPCTIMRKVGPEKFDIVVGVVRGTFVETKALDRNVSLVVGRGTARKSLAEQHRRLSAALGLTVEP